MMFASWRLKAFPKLLATCCIFQKGLGFEKEHGSTTQFKRHPTQGKPEKPCHGPSGAAHSNDCHSVVPARKPSTGGVWVGISLFAVSNLHGL